MQIVDNPALFAALAADAKHSNPMLSSNRYWMPYTARIEREWNRSGLSNFRRNHKLLKGFAEGGVPSPAEPRAVWKRAVWRALEGFPGFGKMVAEYRRLNRVLYNSVVRYRTKVAEICFDDICRSFPEFRPVKGTGNGDADDLFVRDGVEISAAWVPYLARAADFYRSVPSNEVTTLIEIGPGIGLNTLAHVALNPRLHTVVNCDLPQVLYISTQFLKSFPNVLVVDYLEIRDSESVPINPTAGQSDCTIYQIPPWKFPCLSGEADYFLNAFSFQEMGSDIVEAYVSKVAPMLRRGAFIQNSFVGHKPGAGGMKTLPNLPFIRDCFVRQGFIEMSFEPLYGQRYWQIEKRDRLLLSSPHMFTS